MTASHIGVALAWLIISLHVSAHGGRFWTWFVGYHFSAFVIAVVSGIMERYL